MAEITFKCSTCWTEYTVDEKFQAQVDKQLELGYCKFCRRKDPKVPTTAEMDKLFTVEDMRNRFKAMIQCISCSTWNEIDHGKNFLIKPPCTNCGEINYDGASIRSLRTWNPDTGKKKRRKKNEVETSSSRRG